MRKGYSFDIINQILDQIDLQREDEDWQQMIEQQGEKLWKKYSAKFTGNELRMKIKQALYQKGFPIDVIEGFIEEKESE